MIGDVFCATILFFSTAVASGISAGKDVNVTAVEKDINIKGSEVTGENINLTAKGDINITAAANTNKVESNEEKSSGGFGVSVGTTGTFSVYAKSQKSNTDTDKNISGWTQSNVTAKDTLTLTSGADANIIGSKVKGEKVNANIGGDMNIASLQDTDNYKSNSSSYGFSITSEIGGATNFSVNGNKSKMNSEYSSVTDQAGIYAGNRGFDINVANNTDLKGAVIDSTATGDKNTLITGTITFDDIKNKAEYDSSGYGFSYSGERNKDKKEQNILKQGDKGFIPNIPMGSSDEDSSTTKSAIADGTIVLTKPSEQKQDVTQLNRNTQDTLNKLDKIFDKKEIEEKQELAGLFAELSFNAIHELSTKKEGNEVVSKWTPTQRAMAHAAVGFITASLADSKTPISTALANGVNVYVVSEINKNKELREYFNEHPDELQWISAGIGAGIGGMTGGNISDVSSGASAAASGTKNNRLDEEVAAQRGEDPTNASNTKFDGKRTKEEQYQDTTDEQRGEAVTYGVSIVKDGYNKNNQVIMAEALTLASVGASYLTYVNGKILYTSGGIIGKSTGSVVTVDGVVNGIENSIKLYDNIAGTNYAINPIREIFKYGLGNKDGDAAYNVFEIYQFGGMKTRDIIFNGANPFDIRKVQNSIDLLNLVNIANEGSKK